MKKLWSNVKQYFKQIIYHYDKRVLPIVLLSIVVGLFLGVFLKNLKINLGTGIIVIIILNILLFLSSNIDEVINKKKFNIYYWMLNLLSYSILIYVNFDILIKMFKNIKNKYFPIEIYVLIVCSTFFVISCFLVYIFLFSKIRRTKISKSGIEVELDDFGLSLKQNEMLNNIQNCINQVREKICKMDTYVATYISNDLIDENNNIRDTYDYTKLFSRLREISNEVVLNSKLSVLVDFKSLDKLDEIKKEYNIQNNAYNKIQSEIDNLSNNENSLFIERNLVFINYRFTSIEHEGLLNNRIIGIIEFKDIKEGYIDYGSLLLIILKMFDYITTLSILPIYEGEFQDDKSEND